MPRRYRVHTIGNRRNPYNTNMVHHQRKESQALRLQGECPDGATKFVADYLQRPSTRDVAESRLEPLPLPVKKTKKMRAEYYSLIDFDPFKTGRFKCSV